MNKEMLKVVKLTDNPYIMICEPEDKDNELNFYIVYGLGSPTYSYMGFHINKEGL